MSEQLHKPDEDPKTGFGFEFRPDANNDLRAYTFDREASKRKLKRIKEDELLELVGSNVEERKKENEIFEAGKKAGLGEANEGLKERKVRWTRVHDEATEATVIGEGEPLIEDGRTRETFRTIEFGDVPKNEVVFMSDEVQALDLRLQDLEKRFGLQSEKLDEALATIKTQKNTIEDLKNELAIAKGEKKADDEFEWEPEEGDDVFAKSGEGALDDQWTIVKIEGEGQDRMITVRRNQDGEGEPEEVTASYEQFMKWQIEADSIEVDPEDKEYEVGQKVKIWSIYSHNIDDGWNIDEIFEKDGMKWVKLSKVGTSGWKNKFKGEPETLVTITPYERLGVWEKESAEKKDDPSDGSLLKRLHRKMKEAQASLYGLYSNRVIGAPETDKEKNEKRGIFRKVLGAAALMGTGALIFWAGTKNGADTDEILNQLALNAQELKETQEKVGDLETQLGVTGNTPHDGINSIAEQITGLDKELGEVQGQLDTHDKNMVDEHGIVEHSTDGDSLTEQNQELSNEHDDLGSRIDRLEGTGSEGGGDGNSSSDSGNHDKGEPNPAPSGEGNGSESGVGSGSETEGNTEAKSSGQYLDFWGERNLSAVELPEGFHLEKDDAGTSIVDNKGNTIASKIQTTEYGTLDKVTTENLRGKGYILESRLMEDNGPYSDGGTRYYTSVQLPR